MLSTVFEVDDTPPARREEVITIDDSQSQDPYPGHYYDHETCDKASVVQDLHQNTVYTSDTSARENSRSSAGAGKVRKSSAMLAAYATLSQPSPAVTKSSAVLSAEAGASVVHTIQYTPIYLSTASPPITTTITYTLPLCTIPHALVPAVSNKLVLLVDVRERNRQAFYRTFFFDIQAKCNTHLTLVHSNTTHGYGDSETITDYSVEQDKLELGDIVVAYEADSTSTSLLHPNPVHNNSKKAASLQTSVDEESDTTNSTYYLTGLVVERKALTDLISSSAGDARSRCGTARHFVQECRMRHSGCKKAFMCIEGSMNMANIHAVPLVWRDRDYTHPDIIENVEGIVSYMCAVLGRNYSVHNIVRVVQSVSPSATSQLFAAMMAVEIYLANTSPIHSTSSTTSTAYTLSLPCKTDFDKYFRSMGASKRGREAELRQSLEMPIAPISGFSSTKMYEEDREVSAEMIERLVRRFGCWDALLSAYKQCYTSKQSVISYNHCFASDSNSSHSTHSNNTTTYSTTDAVSAEIRCMLLLCELSVGGTLTDRTNLTTSGTGMTSASDSAESSALVQDSILVWNHARRMLCEEGFLQYNGTNNSMSATSATIARHSTNSQAKSVPPPLAVQYLDCLYTSVLAIQPCKVTQVTISAAMAEGALDQYGSLDSNDFICRLLPPITRGHSHASSHEVTLNPQPVVGRKRKAEVTPGGSCTYLNCNNQQYPYMYLQSVDTNDYTTIGRSHTSDTVSVRRCSLRTVVGIVSALDIVEAIIVSTAQYKLQHTSVDWRMVSVFAKNRRSIEIIRTAIATLTARLPADFTSPSDIDGTSQEVKGAPTQCVLIVEGLIHSTSPGATAMGKLESALNNISDSHSNVDVSNYYSSNSSSGGSTKTVTLGHGRPLLPLVEARDVSANQFWLVQLLVACVGMTGLHCTSPVRTRSNDGDSNSGCQCFLTQNAEQTERFVYSLIHETHRQSLLLF